LASSASPEMRVLQARASRIKDASLRVFKPLKRLASGYSTLSRNRVT
jgi:hypothetical protein